jgi:hypothetical protein
MGIFLNVPRSVDRSPSLVPFPWFGMNHIWNRQWHNFQRDGRTDTWTVGPELKDRISKARQVHFNINRFSLNVFDLVKGTKSKGYCVDPIALKQLAALVRYCSKNGLSLLPVLMSGGDPGISKFDPTLMGSRRLGSFMKDYWGRCQALVRALARELLDGKNSYQSIIAYEIENEMNHAIHHPFWDDLGRFHQSGIDMLVGGSLSVRSAELEIFKELDINSGPRPIVVNWDFDYPLFLHNEINPFHYDKKVDMTIDLMVRDFTRLLDAGALMDIIGLDVYPDLGSRGPFGGGRGYTNISVTDSVHIADRLCAHFKNKKIAVTETGRSEYNALHIKDQRSQQDFYTQSIEQFRKLHQQHQNFLGVLYYEWKDPRSRGLGHMADWTFWRKEKNFGIFDEKMRPKQVYEHLSDNYDWSKFKSRSPRPKRKSTDR